MKFKMIEVLQETIIDTIKLIPFLFIAYLLMEYLEHKTSNKTKKIVEKSGNFGPLLGAIVGIVPQCGFSATAANLYAARIISMGTLIAVFLSTSDEMLPILISESAPISLILEILLIKLIIGIIVGFAVDGIIKLFNKKKKEDTADAIEHICEHEHCDCEHEGIIKSAITHTLNILIFILIVTLIINTIIYFIGEDRISELLVNMPVVGILISALIGIIPNCASSVILTQLYLSNVITLGAMIAGLLVGAGVGILVLFKSNKRIKENLSILGILYFVGVISGIIIDLIIK
jgi:hypothetical protein